MIVILEEGYQPHPRCPNCVIFSPCSALNKCHSATTLCTRGVSHNHRQLAEEEAWEGGEIKFWAYGHPLETVTSFRYLVQTRKAMDNYWPVVLGNLRKARWA